MIARLRKRVMPSVVSRRGSGSIAGRHFQQRSHKPVDERAGGRLRPPQAGFIVVGIRAGDGSFNIGS